MWDVYSRGLSWKGLPSCGGVYMIVVRHLKKSEVVYIGTTKNFRRRYSSHIIPRLAQKKYGDGAKILFYFHIKCDTVMRRDLEVDLISIHKPLFNNNVGYHKGKMAMWKKAFKKHGSLNKQISYNIDR